MSEQLKEIMSGRWVSNPDKRDVSSILVVMDIPDVKSPSEPAPRWAWRLLYARFFPKYSVLTRGEAESRFCSGILTQALKKVKKPCISFGVSEEGLCADHSGYRNMKIAVIISGEKLDIPRVENVHEMSYSVYADELTMRSLHCYLSSGAYKVLTGEKYMK